MQYVKSLALSKWLQTVIMYMYIEILIEFHPEVLHVQGSAKRPRPGCVNAAGKLRQEW